ncbi:InlB B-repeat-containing protein [Candidatus Xianfuyuplasma coldseepsis]|uniref:InlB B-repeat-containing protein n=1 Tax=Candidatus Xianfuyuplasma coldseepsis TaxID=2782163 RepID=A0A7L7KRT5_9MOLU|nr:InlB B-repeat-containing protein [Xianfuyuplasma coldseepsis]QMS85129.1 InlB B-repeat-containing protein [Xianfuyuplasma coldseepsis]
MKHSKGLIVLYLLLGLVGCGNTGSLDPTNNDDDKNPTVTTEYVTVSYVSNGGTTISAITIEKGDPINPPTPEKDGYVFSGWYQDASFTTAFQSTMMITSDLILYAKWTEVTEDSVIITFESEYGDTPVQLIGLPGDPLTLPSGLSDLFYDFLGWKIQGDTTLYIETTFPEEDVTLEGVWEKNDTYALNLITTMDVETSYLFEVGDTMTLPDAEERTGYVFIGWYKDASFTEEFDESEPLPANHMTLYERYETIADYFYTVSFETDGGSLIDSQLRVKGYPVLEPSTPIKKGHNFLGWYNDPAYQNEYHFDTDEDENMTIYAQWEFDPNFTAVYLVYSDIIIEELFFDIGESYYLPIVERDGYIFNWWYTHVYGDNYNIYREYVYFPQPLGEDLVLHALFTEAPNMVFVEFETFGGSTARGYAGMFDYSENPVRDWGTFQANPGDDITVYNPSKTGYRFGGWYMDEECTIPVDIISSGTSYVTVEAPDVDTTIYAKWIEDATVTDPDDPDQETTILERLNDMGYTCSDNLCTMEESSGYTYTFNLVTQEFTYTIDTDTIVDGGYRYYDRSITIGPDYSYYYTYYVDENYGFQYYIELELEGNYEAGTNNVIHFYSNVSSEASNVDKANLFINNLIQIYQWIIQD